MGRRTHSPRVVTLVAAAIVFVAALGPGTASAAATVTETVTPSTPNGLNGWYDSGTIDVSFVVVVPMGETETAPRSSACDTTTSITSDTTGMNVSCTVTTDVGTPTTNTVPIKRDATNPALNPQITPATLVLNGPGNATPGATDATSGVASSSCGAVDTTSAGAHSVQCTATDNAGNTNSVMVPYTVQPHGPAASVAITKGDGQVAYVTDQFPASLVVKVTDAQGNPVPGETLTFHAPFSGPSADLSRPSDVTNANGMVSIRAFANDKVGSYVVRAKLGSVGTARFDLRNAAAPYFADGFRNGLKKWNRTGDISVAKSAGQPKPSMLLRANDGKTYATHGFGHAYATACASASVRLNSLGNQAVALMRFRGAGDSGIARVSVETDRELFVRNDRVGGVKLSGSKLPLGEWHEIELCTHIGAKGSVSLFLDGTKILSWRQRLGDRRIAAIHLIENDVKTFSLNVDDVLVDRKPGVPV